MNRPQTMTELPTAVRLTAYAVTGKEHDHYVARIIGTCKVYEFQRTFFGKKSGSRLQYANATITEPGLYQVASAYGYGREATYYIVWNDPKWGLRPAPIAYGTALIIAHAIDQADWTALGRQATIEALRGGLVEVRAAAETSSTYPEVWDRPAHIVHPKHVRAVPSKQLRAEREKDLARLVAPAEEPSAPTLAGEFEELCAERKALQDRLSTVNKRLAELLKVTQ